LEILERMHFEPVDSGPTVVFLIEVGLDGHELGGDKWTEIATIAVRGLDALDMKRIWARTRQILGKLTTGVNLGVFPQE